MPSIIRPWRRDDAPALAALLNNEKILADLRDGLPFPYTEEDARGYIGYVLSADARELAAFAIEYEGRLAGSISLTRGVNIHRRTAELGYYVGEPFWGRGLATRAVGEICRYAFSGWDVLRVFAEPFAHNAASRRVLEKNGFLLEGVLRANAVKGGRVADMCMYSLLSPALGGGKGE